MPGNNGVPKKQPLGEAQLRNIWLQTLSRLCVSHGDDQLALWLGISERHLRNLKSGASLPTADKLWNLLCYDDSAHDELDAAYGVKNVSCASVCSTDPLTLDMIALAHETARDEAPDSPGGVIVTDHELLRKDEARLRKIHRTLTGWLDRLDALHRPTLVRGRAA